jgi:adenylate kinase
MDQRKAVILLGPPGSGKTTIAKTMAARDEMAVLEPGRLFRDEARQQTALGERIEPYLRSGRFVPRDLVAEMMAITIERLAAPVLLFDGFPRIRDQVNLFFLMANRLHFFLSSVIILKITRLTVLKRITGRRVCPNDGSIYNIYLKPPRQMDLCDLCGTRLRQRSEDRPEVVERRLSVYERDSVPVLAYFEREYPLISFEVDAEKPLEQVIGTTASIISGVEPEIVVR